jgi:two-component system, chemotaxis family, protein-glutamate methylesterase/glutaminase
MSLAVPVASTAPASGHAPIRVMVVDDAVVVRGLVSRWIEEEPGLEVVASLRTGRQAVDQVERANPDVVILDVEMPDLDGISALPLLLEKKRDLVVIMASTLTRRNAEVSLKALSLGAADYIPKPETNREVTTSATFRRELIEKIRQLGGRRRRLVPAGAVQARRPVAVPDARVRSVPEARARAEIVPVAPPARKSSCVRSRRSRRACC